MVASSIIVNPLVCKFGQHGGLGSILRNLAERYGEGGSDVIVSMFYAAI